MKNTSHLVLSAVLFAAIFSLFRIDSASAQQQIAGKAIASNSRPSYLENKGQWVAPAKYLFRSGNTNLWITDSGIVYDLFDITHSLPLEQRTHLRGTHFSQIVDTTTRTGHVVRISFPNASLTSFEATDPQPGTTNWFIGSDSTKWVTGARTFGNVKIKNLYSGIDLVFYLDHGSPRYDLVLRPGADPKQIAMNFEGQDGLERNGRTGLRIKTPMGMIEEQGLYAYQIIGGTKRQVRCSFNLAANGSASFSVGAFDHGKPLTIDPLLYSTCLGGNEDEVVQGMGLAVDASGNAYATGGTYSSGAYPAGYPTTTGAYQTSNLGASDIFVTKINSSGNALLYSTYVGGGANDWSMGITVDGKGNAYIVGVTSSQDYPTTPGAYSPKYKASTVVTKLNPAGTGLVYSTYLGADEANAIAIDSSGNVYIAGQSTTDLITTPGAFQTTPHSFFDAFVAKLNAAGSSLSYATFIGGTHDDGAMSVAADRTGDAFITGYSRSSTYPTTTGAYQTAPLNSSTDSSTEKAFVTKVNPTGTTLIYSTYLSGLTLSAATGIAIDAAGDAYIGGEAGSGFPTTQNAYSSTTSGGNSMFATKLNPTGSALIYSTYFGGHVQQDRVLVGGIGVDAFGNASITGALDCGGSGIGATSDAFQPNCNNRQDAVLVRLNSAGSQVLYATYLGGGDIDEGECIAVDPLGNAYIGGFTTSLGSAPIGFPTTKGEFQTDNHGKKSDAFVAKFSFSVPRLSVEPDSVTAPYCGTTSVPCALANGSGGILTVDSVSASDPFYPISTQFPLQLASDSTGTISINFLPLFGGVFSKPMTVFFRTQDGNVHDTTVILTATSSSGSGDVATCISDGTKSVAPLTIVDLPVNIMLSNFRSIDTMQIDEMEFSVSFDSDLLSMDPSRLATTIVPPAGLTYLSGSIVPGRLTVKLSNPSHITLTNQLNLGELLFTAYRGAARSTLVQLATVALTTKGKTYSYCATVEGDFIADVTVEGSGVSPTENLTNVRIFPNPAHAGEATLEVQAGQYGLLEVALYDLLGHKVGMLNPIRLHGGTQEFQLPTSTLTAGEYYVRIGINRAVETRKIVIR